MRKRIINSLLKNLLNFILFLLAVVAFVFINAKSLTEKIN